jgi:hypothetical protein
MALSSEARVIKMSEPSPTSSSGALFGWVWLGVAAYAVSVAGFTAYKIRMGSIEEYGPVIHEFDPYFNFRATEVSLNFIKRIFWEGIDVAIHVIIRRGVYYLLCTFFNVVQCLVLHFLLYSHLTPVSLISISINPLIKLSIFTNMATKSSLPGSITCHGIPWADRLALPFILECNLLPSILNATC